MAKFLRDKIISNVTLHEDALREIFTVFEKRAGALRAKIQEQDENIFVLSIIRFDGKGYRLHTFDELLHYFRSSKTIERIILMLQTASAVSSNNAVGSYIELRLDGSDSNLCSLQVSSDDSEWVDASFSALDESLADLRNQHGWSRSPWFGLLVQLCGVLAAFVVSLWAAVSIGPTIPGENAFVIVFLFVLLIISNAWDYIKILIFNVTNGLFPNIMFLRPEKDKHRWLKRAVVGGTVVALVISVIHLIIRLVADELSRYFGTVS